MFLPALGAGKRTRSQIGGFGGYNHNLKIGAGEWYDMRNLSGEHLPVLTPRGRRSKLRTLTKPNGLFAHDRLCWADGTGFYYDGVLKGQVTDCEKQFVRMGAYVLIWPDKTYYNAAEDEYGSLEQTTVTTGTVTAALCKRDGTSYADVTVSATAPESPTDGQYWLDTSETTHVLKMYATTTGTWQSVVTVYVRIGATGIGAGFAQGESVTISGMEPEALNGDFLLQGVEDDALIVTALIDQAASQTAEVTVRRKAPDMDYVCEYNNRVWGCSSANHEIYACKLGDPKNWYCYMGLSTDSYALTVGSGGDFTGCRAHMGYLLFFKADMIHKLYGTEPSNYQLSDTPCRGVRKGSEKSAVIVNETLYYQSGRDICAYGSALPTAVSEKLGGTAYSGAVAGALGSRYYLSMKDGASHWSLFCYDTQTGVWMREDDTHALAFAALDGDLYYIDAENNGLYSVRGQMPEGAVREGTIAWYAETGDLGLDIPDQKYISGIQIAATVEAGATLRVALMYDEDGTWHEITRVAMLTKRMFTLPICTRRCGMLRVRLSGEGVSYVYSMTLTIEQGSDQNGV